VLADEIRRLDLGACVVAGIPRGGVIVSGPVAELLGAPLVALHTRKLSSPTAREYAFGAMDEDGRSLLDHRAVVALGLSAEDVARVEAEVRGEVDRGRALFAGGRLADFLPGRVVVLVDDGLATGLTMRAAIDCAHRQGAVATVVAVPCAAETAARETEGLLRRRGDHFVCPVVDADFRVVGDYYESFPPVSDDQVAELLGRTTAPAGGGGNEAARAPGTWSASAGTGPAGDSER
jgi:predicted phosphoribosyltransferase